MGFNSAFEELINGVKSVNTTLSVEFIATCFDPKWLSSG